MLVIAEKQTSLVRFASLFYNQTFFKKFERIGGAIIHSKNTNAARRSSRTI